MIDAGLNWTNTKPMISLPSHLGGHYNITHIDEVTLEYLINTFNVNTMYDVGCGPGGMVGLAMKKGLNVTGIDGDFTLVFPVDFNIIIHDFTKNQLDLQPADLAWSCEFLEHVPEEYIDNYFSVFNVCKVVCCTFSTTLDGHNHVNVKNQEYWNNVFSDRGFFFDEEKSLHIRNISSMTRDFVRQTGSIYINSHFNNS
jgi:SAM-dependent methyltransferase